ncbi:MAG: hypothetical protein NDF55_09135 [archaeon GB-1867-005]|nr:hypothetical protein [Candidatus Culexmicrobium cathedralense]
MFNENAIYISIISLIISIVSSLISYRQYRLSKHVQIIRPHSDRLRYVLEDWVKSKGFFPVILDPVSLPDVRLKDLSLNTILKSVTKPEAPSSLPYVLQHLETGYPRIYSMFKRLKEKVKKHNEELIHYVTALCEKVKDELQLPEPYSKEGYAYYCRIISYVFRKILVDYPDKEPIIKEDTQKKTFRLEWNGATLVIGEKAFCEKGLKLIEKLLSSQDIIAKAKLFHQNTNELNTQVQKLREILFLEVIDKIKVGGIIKGKCDVCRSKQII